MFALANINLLLKKVERYIFYAFVFSIPFQIRVVIYEWGASGDEFLSGFLYGTDILLILLFFVWTLRYFRDKEKKRIYIKNVFLEKRNNFLLLFILFLFLSVFKHEFFSFGLYNFLKIFEGVLLYFYIVSNKEIISFNKILAVFIFSAIFQSFLAIGQFFMQSDLGFRYLGETVLSSSMEGVAKVDTSYGKVMRPYGTFTHPNVLGAYLFLAISFFSYLVVSKAREFTLRNAYLFSVILFALFLTFSRSVMLVLFIFLAVLFLKFRSDPSVRKMVFLFLSFLVLFFVFFQSESVSRLNIVNDSENLNFRALYLSVSTDVISDNPLLGVGIGNFVNYFKENAALFPDNMSWAYQPVHNVFMLAASEVGFLGLIFFVLFTLSLSVLCFNNKERYFSVLFGLSVFSVFVLFFFDHYFWDLKQGVFMLWFLFGVVVLGAVKK